ncbi:LuxR family transcriptional regulator [Candidatus Nitromaritima sp. SCGC AAA799-A02]|nr:LuxR family transcriptional regulator [Candidatus Nitromaritima sp. SCGC AAA799-A02]
MQTTTQKTRVFIADDHAVVRQGMKQILSKTDDLAVVEEAEDGGEVLDKINQARPDVLLLDIEMPVQNGWNVLSQLKTSYPKLPVLVLSIYPEEHYGLRFLKSGAAGYINKSSAPDQLVEAIRKVAHGGRFVSPHLAELLVKNLDNNSQKPLHETLSDREFQIFCMIASGIKLKDIAENLSLGATTVSTHRARILEKLNIKSNADLIHYALKWKLVS